MSESWTTPSEHTPETPAAGPDSSAAGPDSTAVAAVDTGADELAVLDGLEADLSAVEQAIESLEQVSTEGLIGEAAALHIAAAVSTERFGPGVDG